MRDDPHEGPTPGEKTEPTAGEPSPSSADSPDEAAFWRGEARGPERPSDAPPEAPGPLQWQTNLWLFLLTVVSVFAAGASYQAAQDGRSLPSLWMVLYELPSGWTFAVPLLSILLFHEFGHYFAAKIHRVPASLPYFIPLPLLSPFGTMGAVIAMRGRIRSRTALLDIGASGPLAGMLVAIPVLIIGLRMSKVEVPSPGGWQEGQSLLYLAIKRLALGPIPGGQDVILSPTALAGWAGLLVTALNLIPVGQLDGGHVAYALFGPAQDRIALTIHKLLLVVFLFNVVRFVGPVVLSRDWDKIGLAFSNSTFWLIWFGLLALFRRMAGGKNHPPTDPGPLPFGRKLIAVLTLILFILLFMPTPLAQT